MYRGRQNECTCTVSSPQLTPQIERDLDVETSDEIDASSIVESIQS